MLPFIALAVLIVGSVGMVQESSKEPQRLRFEKDYPSDQSRKELELVDVALSIRASQAISSGGLRYSIELENSGDELRLRNPLDFLTLELIDEEGHQIQLLSRGIKYLINTRRPDPDRSFKLAGITSNDLDVTQRDEDATFIKLPARAEYVLTLATEFVQSTDGSSTRILPGEYKLALRLALVMEDEGVNEIRGLRSPQISIRLTE